MPHEHLTYPPYDVPLAEAYDSQFESVYVILHPFVSVPDLLAWRTTRKYPSDEQIADAGEKCTWARVAARTGLQTCAKLNQAMLTTIRSIKEELCDFQASSLLNSFLEAEPIWMPAEGRFEPLLQMNFLSAFEALGLEELIFVPEFPGLDRTQRLDVAKLKSRIKSFPNRGSLVAPDESFLFTVDWDSFFTLFYGRREFVTEVIHRQNLEGFFATANTEHAWFNYSLGCSAVTVYPDSWVTR